MTTNTGIDAVAGSSRGRRSVIDAESRFIGTYTTPNDLQIDGQYEGTIDCSGLVLVTETADVNANVTAGAVSVQGKLHGEIGCRGRFEILPSGQVEAQVEAGVIVIHDGARFDGEMRMRTAGDGKSGEAAPLPGESRPGRRGATSEQTIPRFHPEPSRSNGRGTSAESVSRSDSDSGSPSGPYGDLSRD